MTLHYKINLAAMITVAVIVNYLLASMLSTTQGDIAYAWGYILGRALTSVLVPLLFIYILLLPFRWGKVKFTTGPLVSWWVLFALLTVMATIGNMLPQNV